jgi:hypothetical protein
MLVHIHDQIKVLKNIFIYQKKMIIYFVSMVRYILDEIIHSQPLY